ncbi:unnamed protein product [Urochloa humidicola]
MKMAMAAAASSFMLCAGFFAVASTHAEPTTKAAATSEQVPSILPVCKTVGGGSVFFDVQFCMEALGSDGRSANAGTDYHTYSVIAANLLTANATTTVAKIASLLLQERGKGGADDAAARCLRSCQALYGGVVRRQKSGCTAAVRGRRSGEATRCLEEAASAAAECEEGFRKSKVASPVTMENDDAFKLAKLAVALLRMAR